MLVVGVCFLIAAAIGGLVGRAVNTAVGLFVLGAGLFALDGRLGNVTELILSQGDVQSRTPLIMVMVETLLWAVFCLVGVGIIFLIGGRFRDIEPEHAGEIVNPFLSRA